MKRRTIDILLFILFLAGLFVWVFAFQGNSQRTWIALLINFNFFVPLSAGLTVWPAIVITSNGRWMKGIEKIAMTGVSFSIPSILILISLWIGIPNWAAWNTENHHPIWLNRTFLIIRDTAGLVLFWIIAFRFLYSKSRRQLWAAIFVFIYCAVFTLIGFDMVMSLTQEWKSSLFGGYFFVTGAYAGLAAWLLLSIIYTGIQDKKILQDLSMLIMAFCLLTAYLMFSQLLPMWYENLPDETVFLVPRMNFQYWLTISYLLIGLFYVGPFILLIPQKAKTMPYYLAAISAIVIAGMWIESWWLIVPGFGRGLLFGFQEIVIIAFCLIIFLLGVDILHNSRSGLIRRSGEEV